MTKNGIIVIDKPSGITSHNVISKLRWLLDEQKIGHCGTLDPIASGVLPVMVGNAVRASEYLVDHDKRYFAGIELGYETDTEDITGNVLTRFDGKLPTFEEFAECVKSFEGRQYQTPPMYSALKVGGVKLVNLARDGITVDRKEREIFISEIEPFETEDGYFIDVKCSRGTYIRTLCADIGRKLGCFGVMSSLVRTEVGQFKQSDAVKYDDLCNMTREEICNRLIPTDTLFKNLPEARADAFFTKLYVNGEKIRLGKLRGIYGEVGDEFRFYVGDEFNSIGEIILGNDGKKYFTRKKKF